MTTTAIGGENSGGAEEIMLFGVRVVVDSMRKSVSLNDLSQYEHRTDCANVNLGRDKEDAGGGGYASADEAVHRSSSPIGANRVRKRGIPWTEEEHKLFLLGLQKVGKGDWRGISRNFVKTRTPTQVASHAQKYFLRRSNFNRRRRRSSLFDITTDSVAATTPTINHQINKENAVSQSPPLRGPTPANLEISSLRFPATIPVYPLTVSENNEGIESNNAQYPENKLMPTVPTMVDFNLNQKSISTDPSPLSLKLSLSLSTDQSSSSRLSAFQVMPSFNNGDSIISSVA